MVDGLWMLNVNYWTCHSSQPQSLSFCLASRYGSRTQSERPWRQDSIESWRSRKATARALQSLSKLGEIHQLLCTWKQFILFYHFWIISFSLDYLSRFQLRSESIHAVLSRCPWCTKVHMLRSTQCALSVKYTVVKWSHDDPWDSVWAGSNNEETIRSPNLTNASPLRNGEVAHFSTACWAMLRHPPLKPSLPGCKESIAGKMATQMESTLKNWTPWNLRA